ncbi:MAG: hypothetical protein HY335_05795 [Deinococcus sp.]|nr:hypothetical protein [Deinococcus sp.]
MDGLGSRVQVTGREVEVLGGDGVQRFELTELPREFIDWQRGEREKLFERIAGREHIPTFSAHLPVVVTINRDGRFPAHTANKGAGFTARDEWLGEYIELLENWVRHSRDGPWEESLAERVTLARRFYQGEHLDPRRLGLLEIFRGTTYRNILANPCVSLHYAGPGPEYQSYQLNCIAEVVGPGDPRYRFIHAMRQLFEHESFHIHQPSYPFGYLFWVCEVYDKSPRGAAGRRIA